MSEASLRGSAPISAVAVFISLLLAVGVLAAVVPSVSQLFSGVREGLRERGGRGAELIRIYIHSTDETELGEPLITVVSGHDADSWLTDYVVVARDGSVISAGKVGNALEGLRVPPGGRVRLDPRSLGLSYATFAELADAVKAIYFRTSEGNSFGSSYGPPPLEGVDIDYSFTSTDEAVVIVPSTRTTVSISLPENLTFPRLGYALVVRNVIFVDRNGIVRGGASGGATWSDGSFNPSRISPEPSGTSRVPLDNYYVVPGWWNGGACHSLYRSGDTCPSFIEMVEFHPAELFEPTGYTTAAAHYFRFAGERQVVWNQHEGRSATVTAVRPVRVHENPYGIPGTYTPTIPATYTSYLATISWTSIPTRTVTTTSTAIISSPTATRTTTITTMTCTTKIRPGHTHTICYPTTRTYTSTLYTTITSVRISRITYYTTYNSLFRVGTATYTTTVTDPVAVWPEAGLVKAAPVFDPYPARGLHQSKQCGIVVSGSDAGWRACGITLDPPSGPFKLIAIKEAGYTVREFPGCLRFRHVDVEGPWGTYSSNMVSWSMNGLPVGNVTFVLKAWAEGCYRTWGYADITGWVVYEYFWRGVTATATILASDLRSWIRQAQNGSQLSGDADATLMGTVRPWQVVKIVAPIVLLNYVYFISTDPTDLPPPPPPNTGGRRSTGGKVMACETVEEVRPIGGGGGGGGNLIAPGVYGDVIYYELLRRIWCTPL